MRTQALIRGPHVSAIELHGKFGDLFPTPASSSLRCARRGSTLLSFSLFRSCLPEYGSKTFGRSRLLPPAWCLDEASHARASCCRGACDGEHCYDSSCMGFDGFFNECVRHHLERNAGCSYITDEHRQLHGRSVILAKHQGFMDRNHIIMGG